MAQSSSDDDSTDEPMFGAYFAQHVGDDPTQEYENWIGRPVLISEEFIRKPEHFRDIPSWKIGPWTNWLAENASRRMAWNLDLEALGSLQEGANGELNDYFSSFGQQLVAEGHEDAFIRIAGEFNLPHTIHPETEQEQAWFREYWRQIVAALRSVLGGEFDIVWNPNDGIAISPEYARRTWPGDEYVDTVGIDIYDRSWSAYPPQTEHSHREAWEIHESRLDWFKSWAESHGKPLAVPEWGVWTRDGYPHAGGDNPYFIQQMHDWMRKNDVTWQVYFEDLWKHQLEPPETQFPESAATFRRLFSADEQNAPKDDESDTPEQDGLNTLRIEGNGEYAFYAFSATSDVYGESITREDTIEGSTVSGAVGPGTDTFRFEGGLKTLYVGESADVFLNGEQIDPDNYESVVSFAGDGSHTDYTFTVKNGEVTDAQSLTREDDVGAQSVNGAVGPGTDTYTFTGTFEGLDTDGDAAVVLNGQSVSLDLF